jgi:hypothetical protein
LGGLCFTICARTCCSLQPLPSSTFFFIPPTRVWCLPCALYLVPLACCAAKPKAYPGSQPESRLQDSKLLGLSCFVPLRFPSANCRVWVALLHGGFPQQTVGFALLASTSVSLPALAALSFEAQRGRWHGHGVWGERATASRQWNSTWKVSGCHP